MYKNVKASPVKIPQNQLESVFLKRCQSNFPRLHCGKCGKCAETESTIRKPEVNMTGNITSKTLKNPCTQKQYRVTEADLPITCPPKSERIWDAHPRVYLEANDAGKIICPYCSTEFVIQSA